MAGESRVGAQREGQEFERGRPSVNVSAAAVASYAVPNSSIGARGKFHYSFDIVGRFELRSSEAPCPAILGCRIRLFPSPLALLRQLQVTSLE